MGIINKTTDKINVLLDKIADIPEEGLAGKTPVLEDVRVTTYPRVAMPLAISLGNVVLVSFGTFPQ